MISRELQLPQYSTDEVYSKYRADLVLNLCNTVIELNDNSFMVKNHMRYVEKYRKLVSWGSLETIQVSEIKEHVAPIIIPTSEDDIARRFNYLMYSIQLALLQSKDASKPISIVVTTATVLSGMYNIPQVKIQKDVIESVMSQDFWDNVTIISLENVRRALKDLIRLIVYEERMNYYTDFQDQIVDYAEGDPVFTTNLMKDYKKKVEFYLKEHKENLAVYKLRNNKRLSEPDLKELERILWNELGSKADYEKEYGNTPVGKLVRKVTGIERAALNEAFSKFLSEENLNANQMNFLTLIIDYIAANGNIDDNNVLMQEPFRSIGSITSIFREDMSTAKQILDVVEDIRKNSEDIA